MPSVAGKIYYEIYLSSAKFRLCLGHVLFPGTNRTFDTTTGSNFIPFRNVSLTKPVVRLDLNGHMKASGK